MRVPRNPIRKRSWKGVLVVAVVVAALAGVGVGIASGFGAFDRRPGVFSGFSASQHEQADTSMLPPALVAQIKDMNDQHAKISSSLPQLLPNTARVLGTLPNGSKVYGLADTRGDLCLVGAVVGGCGPPLSKKQPITFGAANEAPTTGATFTAEGVAIDGVTSVSFTPTPGDGKEVTVPVKHNVWVYEEPDTHADGAHCITTRLADGSLVNPFPEVPCP
jgi:hypothetical protein